MIEAKGPAGRVALSYFANVRARDADGVANLFAENGRVIRPDGGVLEGREAIRASYVKSFAGVPATPEPVRLVEEDNACSAEIIARFPTVALRVVDIFELNADGLVSEVRIYRQGA